MKPLLEATGLSKMYGRQTVFENLSFVIPEGAHIALIGRNGSGKTTLLKLLSGDEEKDTGNVQLMPWTRLGILKQNEVLPGDMSASSFLSEASGKPQWECAKLGSRFGLRPADLEIAPAALSGGYQMRVKIVRMLLDHPTLLLLDEPVNYLDLPTLLLLESFLRQYTGSFLMTSHDREVLQNVCTSTWEIERGELTTFPGDVETYLAWKEEQAEYARRTNKRLRREIADAQAFADRFRAKASLASSAQSKLKHITKLRKKLRELGTELPTASFKIPCPPFPNGPAVRCVDLSIGYGEAVVASGINLEIVRGSKVGIVGENGRGKSTLLKTLAGALPPIAGNVKWWHRADIGFFSQMSEDQLYPNETVLQAITRAAPPDTAAERLLAAAGTFLFREDDLEKPCGVLSGGERSRVRLARLVLHEHNTLLLDEPTNHLDAETVDALAQALAEYDGTVIVVSHARTFMNAIAKDVYEVRHGTVRRYPGTYEEYVADLSTYTQEITHETDEPSEPNMEKAAHREQVALAREKHRAQTKLDVKMKTLETEKSAILAYYFENPTDYAPEKATRLSEIAEELEQLEKQWLALEV